MKLDYPRVAIIVLNWRKPAETLACLESLAHITYPNAHIVAVDNGSGDDSVARIRQHYPAITLLETGANLGYAGGNNVGIRWALEHGADYTLILNNDVVVAPDFLEPLVAIADQRPHRVIATPIICEMGRPEIIWTLGSDIEWRTGAPRLRHASERRAAWQDAPPQEVVFAPGTALLAPRTAWERVGLMDEAYFLYYEETDWCFHAVHAGFRMVAVPASVVWHDVESAGARTSPAITYYMTRNALRFLARNFVGWQRLRGQALVMIDAAWHSLGDLRLGQRLRARARWRGMADYLAGRFGPLSYEVTSHE